MAFLLTILGDIDSGRTIRKIFDPFRRKFIESINELIGDEIKFWVTIAVGKFNLENIYVVSKRDGLHVQRYIEWECLKDLESNNRVKLLAQAVGEAIFFSPRHHLSEETKHIMLDIFEEVCLLFSIDTSDFFVEEIKFAKSGFPIENQISVNFIQNKNGFSNARNRLISKKFIKSVADIAEYDGYEISDDGLRIFFFLRKKEYLKSFISGIEKFYQTSMPVALDERGLSIY